MSGLGTSFANLTQATFKPLAKLQGEPGAALLELLEALDALDCDELLDSLELPELAEAG